MNKYVPQVVHLFSILWSQSIGISARESCSSEFQSDLSIKVECRYGIEDCSQQRLEVMFPGLYNQSSWGHDAPAELRVSPVCRKSVSGIQLSWKPPQHRGAASIMGFGIHGGHMTDYRCFIVRLVEDVTQSKMATTFSGTIYPVQRDVPYNVVVYSLPRSASSKNVTGTIFTKSCGKQMTSSTWTPRDFNISYDCDTRVLSVEFESPPAQYNFRQFKLTLLSSSNITAPIIDKPRHTFLNIDPGEYDLRMQPFDPHPYDYQRCLCRNSQKACASCVQFKKIFVAGAVTTTPALQEVRSITEQLTHPVGIVLIAIAALIVGAIVIGLAVLLACRRYRSRRKDSMTVEYKAPEESQPPTLLFIRESKTCSDQDKLRLKRLVWLLSEELPTHVVHKLVEGYDHIDDVLHAFYGSRDSVDEGAKLYKNDAECKQICVCCIVALNNGSNTHLNEFLEVQHEVSNVNFTNVLITVGQTAKKDSVSKRYSNMRTFDLVQDNTALIRFIKGTLTSKDNVQGLESGESQSEDSVKATIDRQKADGFEHECTSAGRLRDGLGGKSCPEIPLVRRERYISRDSGHGASDSSYKSSSTEECHSLIITNEQTCTDVRCTMVANGTVYTASDADIADDNESRFYEFGGLTHCPSGLFIPPDPSETSDCDSRDIQIAPCCQWKNEQTYDVCERCVNTSHVDDDVFIAGRRKMKMKIPSEGQSMETLMNKLVAINERSDLLHRIGRPGDSSTVCEEFV